MANAPRRAATSQHVVDAALSFIAGGTTNCTTATLVATSQSGAGYLTIVNLDASATIYVGKDNTVTSSSGMPIPAGGSDTCFWADVTKVYAIGSSTVGWGFRQ